MFITFLTKCRTKIFNINIYNKFLNTEPKNQLTLATWFSLGFSFIMASVLIGLIIEGINCPLSPSFLFFAAMAAIHILGALLHGDIYAIICGVVYFLFIPSCFIFLQIYSIANLNDCSWGKYFLIFIIFIKTSKSLLFFYKAILCFCTHFYKNRNTAG